MPRFYVLDGKDLGKSFDLAEGDTLGRDPSCAATLRDGSVSREHARLERDGAVWVLVDLDSRNGLKLAGEAVQRAELVDDVEVVLGRLPLRVRLDAAAGAGVEVEPETAPEAVETIEVPSAAPRPKSGGGSGFVLEEEIELGAPGVEAQDEVPSAAVELTERERARMEILRSPSQRSGLFASDLTQLPAVTRWALYLLVIAIGGGMAYGAFLLVTYLRSR